MDGILTSEERARIVIELKRYQDNLNTVVGIGGFTFGLACLGTAHPSLYALLGLPIFIILRSHIYSFFPKDIIVLRKLAEEYPKDKEIKIELEKINKFLSVKSMIKNSKPATIGYLFYWFVALVELPSLLLKFKLLEWFYKH
jgi:hypothetical protein